MALNMFVIFKIFKWLGHLGLKPARRISGRAQDTTRGGARYRVLQTTIRKTGLHPKG